MKRCNPNTEIKKHVFEVDVFANNCLLSSFSALRIHVSPDTNKVLEQFGTFDLELRGAVEMKVSMSNFHVTSLLYKK